jgi:DNA polymerase III delta prime subunit
LPLPFLAGHTPIAQLAQILSEAPALLSVMPPLTQAELVNTNIDQLVARCPVFHYPAPLPLTATVKRLLRDLIILTTAALTCARVRAIQDKATSDVRAAIAHAQREAEAKRIADEAAAEQAARDVEQAARDAEQRAIQRAIDDEKEAIRKQLYAEAELRRAHRRQQDPRNLLLIKAQEAKARQEEGI